MNRKYTLYGRWATQIIAAVILLQTLFFKFTLHPQSIEIFGSLGLSNAAIVGLGVIELIVATMILVPRTLVYGSIASLVIMIGAIASHAFILGFGNPFGLAVVTLLANIGTLILNRKLKQ